MKNSGRKYMKGGADEEKQSGGFLGMLGLGGKKDEPNTNNGSNSMLTDLTNTAKGYVGMRQEGESEIAHLQGEVEKLSKEKIDYEKKFKEDLQKMESNYESKKEEEKKKLQDTFNSEMQKMDEKINNIKKKIQDVIKSAEENIRDSKQSPQQPLSGGRRTRRSVGRRSRAHRSRAHRSRAHRSRARKEKKYTRKHRYSRKKRYY